MKIWGSRRASVPGDPKLPDADGNTRTASTKNDKYLDAPESDPARDLLGRVGFTRRVAATVAEQSHRASVVVGLYGPWGDGKTTLLGFIAAELARNERVVVVWFNPWFYAGEAQIFEDFLELVARALGTSLLKVREKLGKAMQQKVGPMTQSVSVAAGPVSAAGSAIGAAGGLLGSPSLRDLRDRLDELLSDETLPTYGKRVVVLMDDIDRLDVDQTAAVFRMIKLAADFPRISFLLAFDPKVVTDTLSSRYANDSRQHGTVFLEKIVQVPLVVPKADPSRVAAILGEWLAETMIDNCPALSIQENARLQNAISSYVWPHVKTLRSGKRLLSTVQFVVPLMKDEINPVDQVLLEAMRLLFPDLYELVARSKATVLNPVQNHAKPLLQQRIAAALADAPSESHTSAHGLLRELFPHLDSLYGNRWHSEHELSDWRRAQRVCSPSHFDRYFGYGLPVGDILDADINAVFTTEPDECRALLTDLLAANDASLVVQKLFEQAANQPADRSETVAGALIAAIPQIGAPPNSFSFGKPVSVASQVVTLLLGNLPVTDREPAASRWLDEADPWFAALWMNWLPASTAHDPDPLLTTAALSRLGNFQAQRFIMLEPNKLFVPDQIEAGFHVLGVCDKYGARDRADDLFATALMANRDLLRTLLANHLLTEDRLPLLNSLSGQGYTRLTRVLPAERIGAAIKKHFPEADQKVQVAIDAVPGSSQMQQLAADPDWHAIQFLAFDQRIRSVSPPAPATVFEPSGTRLAKLSNHGPRATSITFPPEEHYLLIRAGAMLPSDAVAFTYSGGTPASMADDRSREKLLTKAAEESGLRSALDALCRAKGLGELPESWLYQTEGRRETAELFLDSSTTSASATPSLNAHMRITTGWASQTANEPSPIGAVMGILDIVVRLSNDSPALSLTELRDILVAATTIFEITQTASYLVNSRPYSDGEGALWVATNQAGLGDAVDLGDFEKISPSLGASEVELNTVLPLEPQGGSHLIGAGLETYTFKSALAVEVVKRILQETNHRGYEHVLHDLLREQRE